MPRRLALVTGSSRGIGAEIAIRLAKDGYDIAVNYNKSEEQARKVIERIKDIGVKGIMIKADVSNRAQVEEMFDSIRRSIGNVDILVCNAGISYVSQIQDITQEEWRQIFSTNVEGTFNVIQCALPYMLSEKKGSIITISSMWGLRGASCESAYSASKAAIIGLSRSLASELAPSGIRVNSVAPGVIHTDMMDDFSKETLENLAEETPLRKLGSPKDVAEIVSFLASDNSSFITGQVVGVDGGFTI